MKSFDLVIIGCGPNGIKAAIEFNKTFPHWNTLLLDKGYGLSNLEKYPNVRWHSEMESIFLDSNLNSSIPSNLIPTSNEVKHYFEYVIKEKELNIQNNSDVFLIKKLNELIQISYKQNDLEKIVTTKYAILATGIYENKKIPKFYKSQKNCFFSYELEIENKNIVLVGGGNSAHDVLINLLPKNKINWIIRSSKYKKVHEILNEKFTKTIKAYSSNLKIYFNTEITNINEELNLISLSNDKVINNFDKCLIMTGFKSVSNLVKESNIKTKGTCIDFSENYESSINNLYIFGSAMSKWNDNLSKAEDTFILNGNPKKLKVIIDSIKSKEAKYLFDFNYKKNFIKKRNTFNINNFFQNKFLYFLSLLIPEIIKLPIRKLRNRKNRLFRTHKK